ncbi:MAG: hypothetical protein JO311_01915 [Candidatus Eremiobacteraeota bacterium]|nr:hypothetical protein [Candidatus Eremiobacteraeota bacterium]
MLYNAVGGALALGIAALAWSRSRRGGGFYDAHVYGMHPGVHRTYAIAGLIFGLLFAALAALHQEAAGIAALGVFALVAVFYGASFLQGARDSDD